MKLNKMTLIAALALGGLLTLSGTVNAQDAASTNTPAMTPPTGGPGGRGMRPTIESLTKALDLTDDQKPKVKAAMDDMAQKMKDLRADSSVAQEDRRAKMKTIRDAYTAKMKEILTADQFAKYQKMPQGGRRATPPPATN